MGTHISFFFRGYNTCIRGLKPSFFMVLGSKGSREWKTAAITNNQFRTFKNCGKSVGKLHPTKIRKVEPGIPNNHFFLDGMEIMVILPSVFLM